MWQMMQLLIAHLSGGMLTLTAVNTVVKSSVARETHAEVVVNTTHMNLFSRCFDNLWLV